MIYLAYETLRQAAKPVAWSLELGAHLARHERNPLRESFAMNTWAAAFELPARMLKEYNKPEFRIWDDSGETGKSVHQATVEDLPFAQLLKFEAEDGTTKPKVMLAAALSGHHATLLQGTVRAFVQDFDTYITDWKDAREVPGDAGQFGFDEYVDHLIAFLELLGPGTHLVATCQAAPPAMVATAVLARTRPELVPASLTLMGGPIDTRVSPTFISRLAGALPLKLFEWNNIHTIPFGNQGSGRKVYPGFYQLLSFILLNPKPHIRQHIDFVRNSLKGDTESVEKFRAFYDEYFAVLDMDEKFYIETLRKVFFEHHIPTGQMEFRGDPVDFTTITDMPLLTVEGANDHLCPPGQTEAAHAVFENIRPELRHNHLEEGVGHYGVFSGSRFQASIYPAIRKFILNAMGEEYRAAARLPARKKQRPEALASADIPI